MYLPETKPLLTVYKHLKINAMALKVDYDDVKAFLNRCEEPMLKYLELQLAFANDVRSYQLQYSVSNEELANEYCCDLDHVKKMRKGATEVSLRDMAKIRVLYANRISKENESIKVSTK